MLTPQMIDKVIMEVLENKGVEFSPAEDFLNQAIYVRDEAALYHRNAMQRRNENQMSLDELRKDPESYCMLKDELKQGDPVLQEWILKYQRAKKEYKDAKKRVLSVVNQVESEVQRRVLALHYIKRMGWQAIADATGVTEKAVRTAHKRGVASVQAILDAREAARSHQS